MRTTLKIDERLLSEAMEFSHKKTKAAVINAALEEYVRRKKIRALISLAGKIDMDENWEDWERQELALNIRLREGYQANAAQDRKIALDFYRSSEPVPND